MATILPEDQKKKPNSFGDAAAAAAAPGLGIQQVGNAGTAAPAATSAPQSNFVAPQPVGLGAVRKKPNSFGDAAEVAAAPGLGVQQVGNAGAAAPAATSAPQSNFVAPQPVGLGAVREKPNSFGDAAAVAAEPRLGIQQVGGASIPPPLPMLTASLPPSSQAVQLAANEAASPAAGAVPKPPVAPLDAQAASDRQQIGGFIGGAVRANDIAGAAILDAGMVVPRSALKLYDNTVVRGVRAAGMNMAPTSPLLAVPGANPDSMTPMLDRQFSKAPGVAAAGAPRAVQADVRRVDNALASPAVGAAASAVPVSPADASAGGAAAAGPVGAQPGAVGMAPSTVPSGAVRRVGNSYSGTNVSGDVSINGREAGGGSISMLSANFVGGAPGVARATETPQADVVIAAAQQQSLNQGAGVIDPEPLGASADGRQKFFDEANLRTVAAKSSWSPRGGYQRDPLAVRAALTPIENRQRLAEGAMREAGDTARTTMRDAGETARLGVREAGDDRRAAATNARLGVRDAIDRDEFGLKRTAAEFDNRGRARLEAAQLELQNATTPEAIRTATQKVLALGGKEPNANRYTVIPGGQSADANGVVTRDPSAVLDNQTGQIVQAGGVAAAQAAPPAAAIAMLKANPALAAQFDQKYGAGASARALGQQK